MRVRHGWSGEIRPNVWGKVFVEVDETDLRRVMATAGLVESFDTLSSTDAFQLLDAECEWLLLAKLITRYEGGEANRARLVELTTAKAKVLERIRAAREGG